MGTFRFFGKVFEQAFGDVRSSHAEATSAGGFHHFADVVDFGLPVLGVRLSDLAVETFGESLGADSAGEALSATLVRKEGHGIVGDLHHVAGIIKDHDSASPQKRAVGADAGFVESDVVENLMPEEAAGKPRHRDRLNGATFFGASRPVVKKSFERESDGHFVISGAFDITPKG